ncbi:MAG: response regulator [Candidatus Sumerlaeaceae bacterium]
MPKTILIAEDNDDVRNLIKLSLQFKGYNMIEAADGAAAFQTLEDNSDIDLMISDIEMPIMNGLELLAKVRADERFKGLPIVICSAEKNVTEDDLLHRGASAYLLKPMRPIDLLSTVQKLLG